MNITGKGGFQDHPENAIHEGRPKGVRNLTTLITEKLPLEDIADIVIKALKENNIKVLLHTYDHIDGRAVMKQIISQEPDEEFVIVHKYADKSNGETKQSGSTSQEPG